MCIFQINIPNELCVKNIQEATLNIELAEKSLHLVAQLVEYLTGKPKVTCSIPGNAAKHFSSCPVSTHSETHSNNSKKFSRVLQTFNLFSVYSAI